MMRSFEVDAGEETRHHTYDPLRTPYEVDSIRFPETGTVREQLEHLVRYAILAPSSHNTQPWRFRLLDDRIAVYADYTRRLPVVDPGNRELLMSIGAAVMNLRIAARHFRFDTRVEYNVSGDSEMPIADVHLERRLKARHDQQADALFFMITRRHTNRRPFLMARVPEAILGRLSEAADKIDVDVILSTDPNKNAQVAELVAEAERILQANPDFRRELGEWMRTNNTQKPDGMTGASFGIGGIPSTLAPWAVKSIDLGGYRARRDRRLCMEAPALCVLCSEDSVPLWLEVGEALQRILLTVVNEGLQYSFFNMPIELPEARKTLRKLLGIETWPQLLLRIGYSLEQPVPTPRRPVEDCIM